MVQTIYPQMNTLVRIKEAKLLNTEQQNSLKNASDYYKALQILRDSEYSLYFEENSFKNPSYAISRSKFDLLKWAYEISPNQNLIDMFALYEIVHNLKVLLKEKLTGQSIANLYLKSNKYSVDDLKNFINLENKSDLPLGLGKAINKVIADFSHKASVQRVELIMDGYYFSAIKSLAALVGDNNISYFISEYIDLYNLSALLQIRDKRSMSADLVFAEGGTLSKEVMLELRVKPNEYQDEFLKQGKYTKLWRKENFAEFDVFTDNYLLSKCQTAKLTAFGMLPLAAYLYARCIEMKNIRLILTAKQYEISSEIIRKRIRAAYEL